MNLQQKYYDFIASGSKVFEGRLGIGKDKNLKIGDIIVFNDSLRVRITSIHIFSSYEDAMRVLDFKKLIPDAESIDEAVEVYEEFYSEKRQMEFGVWVFGFELA